MMKLVAKATWIITAVASVNVGLAAFGHDLFGMLATNFASLIMPLQVLVGIAGVASLAMLFMPCGSNCCE